MNEERIAEIKAAVGEAIDRLQPKLIDLSKRIHRHPETKFEEYQASQWVSEAAEAAGFRVEKPIGGLETAFRASCSGAGEGPTIAFLAEYDALPKLGHACGHNLIAAASLGAALGLQTVMDKPFDTPAATQDRLPGSVQLIGTPGEEGGGGKVILAEAGVFDDADVAMMFHPSGKTILWKHSLARRKLLIEFVGKSTHAAAAPEKGINALDATIQTFQNINALRQHITDDARIHGIITHGGNAPNIVPDYSASLFYIRAIDDDYCDELLEKVKNCARGAAIATGARVEMEMQGAYKSMRMNMALAQTFKANLETLGWAFDEVDPAKGIGSTDMGDVSHVTASIHPTLSIGPEDLAGHSTEFAEAAVSEEGQQAMIAAAKALAATAVDVLLRPSLFAAIRAEFEVG
jgi:amidohydrolase